MGRRKERRLAAMASSRRVKLDLFAEPSDLGESSAHDKVGEDMDAKPGAPKSPSLSGQTANPLVLLGQYSDEDSEEESEGRHSDQDNSSADKDEHAKHPGDKEMEQETDGTLENPSADEDGLRELGTSGSVASHLAEDSDTNILVAAPENLSKDSSSPDSKTVGHVESSWKMVLHEESNQYYYWNIDTGETSWEVPDVFSQAVGFTGVEMVNAPTISANLLDGSVKGGAGNANEVSVSTLMYEDGPEANHFAEIYDVGQNNLANGSIVVGALASYPYQTSAVGGRGSTFVGSEQSIHEESSNQLDEAAVDLPAHLVRRSELLLERLKSHRFDYDTHHHDLGMKCSLEIEIRLSDFKSLLVYGSLLNPFWMHSDIQVRRLEQTVDDVLLALVKSDEKNESSTIRAPTSEGQDAIQDGAKQGSNDGNEDNEHTGNVVECRDTQSEDNAFSEANPKLEFQLNEDVDMDVDMEVEDIEQTSDVNKSEVGCNHVPSAVQFVLASPLSESQSEPLGDEFVPPPPEEEWIPPPPPDDEEIPPPPPDEPPPDALCQPQARYPEPAQSFSYTAENNLTYPGYSFTYYGGAPLEVASGSLYGHTEGFPTSVSNPQIYYEAVSSSQPGLTTLMANPVESTVYYGLQATVVPTVPAVTSVETTSSSAVPDPLGYDAAFYIPTVNSLSTAGTLPKPEGEASAHGHHTEATSHAVQVPGAVVSAPAAIFMEENTHGPSSRTFVTPSVATSGTSTVADGNAAKDQVKALRGKKRSISVTSSLKSNKKVSSLVDKWKAVKEKIHEEEQEEPESALEILERKRQREIEEWHSQQLASGEARENANFLPLGGDWRERVKRRRAQKLASDESRSDVAASESSPPKLANLSTDLPPGWQAYWDESSKQVYYGNALTNETSWSRPK